jgi:multicomponent K+:H+ antiporter subunit D
VATSNWIFMALLIVSGLFALVALSRAGIRFFWTPVDRPAPVLRLAEFVPIALLVALCVVFTVRAEAVLRYTSATAAALYHPRGYIDAVFAARPLVTPTNAERLGVPPPGISR